VALPFLVLAAAAALGLPHPAYAQAADAARPVTAAPACPIQPQYPLPSTQGELRELAARLDAAANEPGCLADAFFLAWRGAVLMALGQSAAAIEPLERALLVRPDLPAAQLDLALALAATGDVTAGAALLEQLRGRSDLPASVRAGLDRQAALVAGAGAAPRWHHRLQLSSLVGVDNNLNNAPSVAALTLTLPQGNVTLPLASTSLPKQGAAMLNSVQWQGLRPSGSSLWLLQSELRARVTGEGATDFQQGDVAATWLQAPEAARQWVGRVSLTHLRFGGRALLQSGRASLQYQLPRLKALAPQWPTGQIGDCRPAAGLEVEDRRYPSARELDGLYHGGAVSLLCASGKPPVNSFFSLQLRAGHDRQDDETRPGGRQVRSEFRVQWDTPLSSPWPGVLGPGRLGLQWATTRQADSSGYSPLLENNAVRHTTRHALQAEASFSLGGGLSAVTSGEISNQRSNLPAFGARQRSVYFGLRWELM
jgi:hypothetical protein